MPSTYRARPAREAEGRRHRGVRVTEGANEQRVREDLQDVVDREDVARALEHPAAITIVHTDELQVLLVPGIGVGPVLLRQPFRVRRHVRDGVERGRQHRLLEQTPAFLDLLGAHEVHLHQVGLVRLTGPVEGVAAEEIGVLGPGLAGGTRLRSLGQPHLDTLIGRVCAEKAMERGGARTGQSAHEIGRSIATSTCPGLRANAASLISLPLSADTIIFRATTRPCGVRSASFANESNRTRKPSRCSSPPKSSRRFLHTPARAGPRWNRFRRNPESFLHPCESGS